MKNYGFVKGAALSPRVTVAAPAENAQSALSAILKAKEKQAQIIALPELFLSGYTCGDLFRQDRLMEACEDALLWLMENTKNVDSLVVIGLPVRACGKLFNCAAILQKGELLGLVPKAYIPNYNEFYEKRWFSSGRSVSFNSVRFCGCEVPFGKLLFELEKEVIAGVEICEDLWIPLSPGTIMALNGANILINISASNETVAKNDYRRMLIEQQSAKCNCGYIYASSGTGESSTDLVFSGACTIAENGLNLAEAPRFQQNGGAAYACMDIDRLNSERRLSSFADNAGEYIDESFMVISACLPALDMQAVDRRFSPHPFVPGEKSSRNERCQEILSIQTTALAKRLEHTGMKKLVLGISGGLDSTLALIVSAETMKLLGLPASNILCLTMPGFGTTTATKSNAVDLAACLGAQLKEIDIRPACIQHMQDIGHDMNIHNIVYENVQARERTYVLMDMANKENALLVGTGDLSELALGWCTYNGDHMSMYSVNCGVPKTLVRYIVGYFAENSDEQTAKVLNGVLDTPISPELLPPDEQGQIAQKTEDTLGPYEVHDFFLYYFLRFGTRPEKLLFMAQRAFKDTYSDEQLKKWLTLFIKRFFTQQFKRSCMPDGPKIGTVCLSPRGDWRMPSDADYTAWLI